MFLFPVLATERMKFIFNWTIWWNYIHNIEKKFRRIVGQGCIEGLYYFISGLAISLEFLFHQLTSRICLAYGILLVLFLGNLEDIWSWGAHQIIFNWPFLFIGKCLFFPFWSTLELESKTLMAPSEPFATWARL